MSSVEIHHRATGPASGQVANHAPQVVLEILDEVITAQELISRAVAEHIRKTRGEAEEAQKALKGADSTDASGASSASDDPLRHLYLSEDEIRLQEGSGKIAVAASTDQDAEPLDFEQQAIDKALAAFRVGRFAMLIGGRQVDDLSTELNFEEQAKVIFLRLVPLAGG